MLSPEIRRKLSELNAERGPTTGWARAADGSAGASPSLAEILPGRVHEHESGRLYICERRIEDLYPAGREKVVAGMGEVRGRSCEPEEALFLDIETCGLANCPLFMVGLLHVSDGDARVTQLFARDYSEEAAVLAYLTRIMPDYRMLITFNGKTFDVPYMHDRMVFHRIRYRFRHEHLDLLQEARRLWRGRFPDCRLQTLEAHICGRRRVGDTPGHLIPQLYHDFVRTGNAEPLEGIFHHNALDLITMAELLAEIGRGDG